MGKSIKETMQEFTVNQALNYLEGNPEENIPKLMAFVDRFMPKDWYTSQRNAIRKSIEEKNNWYQQRNITAISRGRSCWILRQHVI